MTIAVTMWRDEGPIVSGRGTPRAVTNINMKSSDSYTLSYFPSSLQPSGTLLRTLEEGKQTLSYSIYTYFKLEGVYNVIKNTKILVSVETIGDANGSQLFYKLTNVYATPTDAYDGNMMMLVNRNVVLSPVLYPNMSNVGPHQATTRATSFANVSPLFTNYLVTQVRVNANSSVGNTPEYKIRFECKEYGVF